MKPILYRATETEFDNNGIGILSDAVSCFVVEERNGAFELSMQYPISGIHYEEIELRSIVKAKANQKADPQLFRVYQITKPMNGLVSVYAEHISYDLSGIPLEPFTSSSVQSAMQNLSLYAVGDCPFEFSTEKETVATMKVESPCSIRSQLGGKEGSILDVYRGEYEFDNFNVILHNNRGENRGVTIRYGKNLTDLEQDANCQSVYTGLYPYWLGQDGTLVTLTEKIIPAQGTYDFDRILVRDFSESFETQPTEQQLRTRATAYVNNSDLGVPKVNLKVSFVQLEQTSEYRNLALLERVYLCDTVTVIFPKLGVNASAQVIKVTYNCLLDRVESVELGDAKANMAQTIVEQQKTLEEVPTKNTIEFLIDQATADILGASGGCVRLLDTDNDGTPDTLYIADDPDPTQAVKVWRFNYQGWGASSNGYNGPFTMSATLSNGLIADFITAGTLQANLVKILGTTAFYWDSSNIFIIDPSQPNNQIRIGQYDGANYGIGFTHDGGSTWNVAMNFNGLNVQATGFAKVFVQLHDPDDGTIQLNTGDLWIQSNVNTLWSTVGQMTWADVGEGIWQDYIALEDPITYVWDGSAWQKSMDTSLLHTMETELAQTQSEIALKANTSYVDSLAQTVATNSANITLNANAITAEVTRATTAEGTLSSRITTNADSITAEVTRATAAEGTLSTTITQDKASWQATFQSMGADGYTASGITTIGASGITVTHSSVSNYKTQMSANGFRILNSSNTVVGGLMTLNGSVVTAMNALYNPSYSNFVAKIGQFSGAQDAIYGVQYNWAGTPYLDMGIGYIEGSVVDTEIISTKPLVIYSSQTLEITTGLGLGSAGIYLDQNDNITFRFSDSGGIARSLTIRDIWNLID